MMFDPELLQKTLPIDTIFLDLENPRFAGDFKAPQFSKKTDHTEPKAQESIRRFLITSHNVTPLILSIQRTGFLCIDRIVVREVKKGSYVVIEGNRRLAAIKTILGDIRRKVLDLPQKILNSLQNIEVLQLKGQNQSTNHTATLLQGIRHISGVRNWGPFQQGKLIHDLVDGQGMKLCEAALLVGLSPSRVGMILKGYYGLLQMQQDNNYGQYANVSLFSHFEQAHLKIPVRNWLGWDNQQNTYLNDDALFFFYEKISNKQDSQEQIILSSKEVRDCLPAILEHEEARTAYLEQNFSLKDAYFISQKNVLKVEPFLRNAIQLLSQIQDNEIISAEEKDLIKELHLASEKLYQKSVSC